MATYLSLVNDVLVRLRESQVTAIGDTEYSTLIGKMINDSKRAVEDAFKWNALSSTISLATVSGTSTYTVTGLGLRPQDIVINNTTTPAQIRRVPIQMIMDWQDLATNNNALPTFYAINGSDGTDMKIELFPTPDAVYNLSIYAYVPQVDLSADSDTLTVPSEPVVLGAYARALVERGEDQGLASSEAYGLFRSSLADHIAIEANLFVENDCWSAC